MLLLLFIISIILVWKMFTFAKRRLTPITFLNKTVWVTGASSGIGEQLTYRFAKYGANLIISSRNVEKLEKVKNSCINPDKVTVLPLDLAYPEDAFKKAEEFFKSKSIKVDILVNNAGVSQMTFFLETPHEVEVEMANINYMSPILLTRLVLPGMLKDHSGQIVLTNSVLGKFSNVLRTSYCGTKFALRGFFDALRCEVADQGIKITSIYPGQVCTDVTRNARVEWNRGFGHQDKDVGNGENVEHFADRAIKAIFFQDEDAVISISYIHYVFNWLSGLWPEFVFQKTASEKDKRIQARNEALAGKYDDLRN